MADCDKFSVRVTQLGLNTSQAKDKDIGAKKTAYLRHEEHISFLSDQFKYKLLFNPPPPAGVKSDSDLDASESVTNSNKRQNCDSEMSKKKRVKTSDNGNDIPPWFDDSLGKVVTEEDEKGGEWRSVAEDRLFIRMLNGDKGSPKVAAFDIDGTIITTKSGKVFPVDEHDWRILYPEVPGKLKSLVEEGYKLVLITNQAGIAKGKLTIKQFSKKVSSILSRLGVNAMVFVSTADTGYFRKPRPGIWDWLELRGNSGVQVSRTDSFYCGDAAGREAGFIPGKKKDFSCSDRLFAENIGVTFYTPEEFFLGKKPTSKFNKPFRPSKALDGTLLEPSSVTLVPSSQTLSLMVGIQGSGKGLITDEKYKL